MVKEWDYKTEGVDKEWYFINNIFPYIGTVNLLISKVVNIETNSVTWDWQITVLNGNEGLRAYFDEKKCGYVHLEDAKEWCLRSYNEKLYAFKERISKMETISICKN